jgi:hypothetical protein
VVGAFPIFRCVPSPGARVLNDTPIGAMRNAAFFYEYCCSSSAYIDAPRDFLHGRSRAKAFEILLVVLLLFTGQRKTPVNGNQPIFTESVLVARIKHLFLSFCVLALRKKPGTFLATRFSISSGSLQLRLVRGSGDPTSSRWEA